MVYRRDPGRGVCGGGGRRVLVRGCVGGVRRVVVRGCVGGGRRVVVRGDGSRPGDSVGEPE